MERTHLQSSCIRSLWPGDLQSGVALVGICLALHVQDECLYCPVASAAVLCVCNTLVWLFWRTWVIHPSLRAQNDSQRELGASWQVVLLRQKQLMARNLLQKDKLAKVER